MSQAPVADQTGRQFEPPRNTQFSVFLDNRVGKLLDLVEVFDGGGITLAGLSVLDTSDYAVVRIITSNCELAKRLLQRNELPFSVDDVLAVELAGSRTLSQMCSCLLAAELNIHYAYPLLVRPRGLSAIVLHTDDPTFAAQILRKKMFTLLGENDMGGNAPRNHPGTPNDPSGN